MQPAWVVAGEASGRLEAEILRAMLESLGLHVQLSQESASSAYSLGVGPLGTVEILVPEEDAPAARAAIEDYFTGKSATEDEADK
jgi:hypothetical protein